LAVAWRGRRRGRDRDAQARPEGVQHDAAVVKELLEFGCRRGAIVGGQIGLASNVGGIQRLQTAIALAGSSIEMFAEIIQVLFVAIE
jgi:hypothetical protein